MKSSELGWCLPWLVCTQRGGGVCVLGKGQRVTADAMGCFPSQPFKRSEALKEKVRNHLNTIDSAIHLLRSLFLAFHRTASVLRSPRQRPYSAHIDPCPVFWFLYWQSGFCLPFPAFGFYFVFPFQTFLLFISASEEHPVIFVYSHIHVFNSRGLHKCLMVACCLTVRGFHIHQDRNCYLNLPVVELQFNPGN